MQLQWQGRRSLPTNADRQLELVWHSESDHVSASVAPSPSVFPITPLALPPPCTTMLTHASSGAVSVSSSHRWSDSELPVARRKDWAIIPNRHTQCDGTSSSGGTGPCCMSRASHDHDLCESTAVIEAVRSTGIGVDKGKHGGQIQLCSSTDSGNLRCFSPAQFGPVEARTDSTYHSPRSSSFSYHLGQQRTKHGRTNEGLSVEAVDQLATTQHHSLLSLSFNRTCSSPASSVSSSCPSQLPSPSLEGHAASVSPPPSYFSFDSLADVSGSGSGDTDIRRISSEHGSWSRDSFRHFEPFSFDHWSADDEVDREGERRAGGNGFAATGSVRRMLSPVPAVTFSFGPTKPPHQLASNIGIDTKVDNHTESIALNRLPSPSINLFSQQTVEASAPSPLPACLASFPFMRSRASAAILTNVSIAVDVRLDNVPSISSTSSPSGTMASLTASPTSFVILEHSCHLCKVSRSVESMVRCQSGAVGRGGRPARSAGAAVGRKGRGKGLGRKCTKFECLKCLRKRGVTVEHSERLTWRCVKCKSAASH